jgi:hypothetical protein
MPCWCLLAECLLEPYRNNIQCHCRSEIPDNDPTPLERLTGVHLFLCLWYCCSLCPRLASAAW